MASIDPVSVAPNDGTADCEEGYDPDAARFPGLVTAVDAASFQDSEQATNSATLTGGSDMAPHGGTGTVAVAYPPDSDTAFALPAEWNHLSAPRAR